MRSWRTELDDCWSLWFEVLKMIVEPSCSPFNALSLGVYSFVSITSRFWCNSFSFYSTLSADLEDSSKILDDILLMRLVWEIPEVVLCRNDYYSFGIECLLRILTLSVFNCCWVRSLKGCRFCKLDWLLLTNPLFYVIQCFLRFQSWCCIIDEPNDSLMKECLIFY